MKRSATIRAHPARRCAAAVRIFPACGVAQTSFLPAFWAVSLAGWGLCCAVGTLLISLTCFDAGSPCYFWLQANQSPSVRLSYPQLEVPPSLHLRDLQKVRGNRSWPKAQLARKLHQELATGNVVVVVQLPTLLPMRVKHSEPRRCKVLRLSRKHSSHRRWPKPRCRSNLEAVELTVKCGVNCVCNGS